MNKNPIGVLDSGIGGLSIWKEIVTQLPGESTIYIADSKNCPYGTRDSEEIYKLSRKLVELLIKKKAKIIVIACNTITVACLDRLRKDFPDTPIIGTVPVVKTASEFTKNRKIGILSTTQTAKSKYQKDLIKKFTKGLKVLNLGTDRLVPLIEDGKSAREIKTVLNEVLKPFLDFRIDTLVLGCSHFPLIKSEMQKVIGNKVKILDSSSAIARQVKRVIAMNNAISGYNKPKHTFYTTGIGRKLEGVSRWKKINL